MASLQKPRKLTVIGDDGRQYPFLCKPKDDLRKDARMMEFESMLVKLLKKDSEARNRRLSESIRKFRGLANSRSDVCHIRRHPKLRRRSAQ
jgi:phosphatidylinositol kinase/protein kinase (PI-3  family)